MGKYKVVLMILGVDNKMNSPSVNRLAAGIIDNWTWFLPVRRFHFDGPTGNQKTSSKGKVEVGIY